MVSVNGILLSGISETNLSIPIRILRLRLALHFIISHKNSRIAGCWYASVLSKNSVNNYVGEGLRSSLNTAINPIRQETD